MNIALSMRASIDVVPLGSDRSFGAETIGFDPRSITGAGFGEPRRACIGHQVQVVPEQAPTDPDQGRRVAVGLIGDRQQ